MGRLSYDKWDKLELSDDSDIEEHPNIDKRSMINWKKRDILEKREQRKQRIANYRMEIQLNGVLLPRLAALRKSVSDATDPASARAIYAAEVQRLVVNPSQDKPPTGHAKQPTYDEMLLDLYKRVGEEAKAELEKKGQTVADDEGKPFVAMMLERFKFHEAELVERSKECEKLAVQEEEEQKKKITSEDVKDGFTSGHVNQAGPSILEEAPKKAAPAAGKGKAKETTIEVLNPGASSKTEDPPAAEDDDAVPTLTIAARRFSNIPFRDYSKSFAFIQSDPSVLAESTTDALLGEAFDAELKGEKARAKRCVEKGLMIQYCRKLGKDGVRLFFQRMQQAGPKAEAVFMNDVEDTYTRMEKRVFEMKAEQGFAGDDSEREQIQLVAEDDGTQIGFNIPDGPPPEDLRLEGEGVQDLDIAEVRKFLQMKWELFQAFPESLREAMKKESLEEVNKVLGRMKLEEAEDVVEKMQQGGMLSFSESGVRDMTEETK